MSAHRRNGEGSLVRHANRSASRAIARRRPPKRASAEASYEKYVTLARAAALSGDAVETENYYQHAEHYFRLMKDQRIESGHEEADRQQDRSGVEGNDESS